MKARGTYFEHSNVRCFSIDWFYYILWVSKQYSDKPTFVLLHIGNRYFMLDQADVIGESISIKMWMDNSFYYFNSCNKLSK